MLPLLLMLAFQDVDVRIVTRDGQCLHGAIAEPLLPFRGSRYELRLPLRSLRRIRAGGTWIVEGDGLRLAGVPGWRDVVLRSKFGSLRIPAAEIDSLEVLHPGPVSAEHTVELVDGSRFPGTLCDEALPLLTGYGRIEVPWAAVTAFDRARGRVVGRTTSLTGVPLCGGITVRTSAGVLEVPLSEIAWITRRCARTNVALGAGSEGAVAGHYLTDGVRDKVEGSDFFGHCLIGSFMTVDLGGACRVDEIRLHLWNGDPRKYGYRLEVSGDGRAWKALSTRQDARGRVVETFDPLAVRYVRVYALANTANNRFHLLEIEVMGHRGG